MYSCTVALSPAVVCHSACRPCVSCHRPCEGRYYSVRTTSSPASQSARRPTLPSPLSPLRVTSIVTISSALVPPARDLHAQLLQANGSSRRTRRPPRPPFARPSSTRSPSIPPLTPSRWPAMEPRTPPETARGPRPLDQLTRRPPPEPSLHTTNARPGDALLFRHSVPLSPSFDGPALGRPWNAELVPMFACVGGRSPHPPRPLSVTAAMAVSLALSSRLLHLMALAAGNMRQDPARRRGDDRYSRKGPPLPKSSSLSGPRLCSTYGPLHGRGRCQLHIKSRSRDCATCACPLSSRPPSISLPCSPASQRRCCCCVVAVPGRPLPQQPS